jgi:hypothetical protein
VPQEHQDRAVFSRFKAAFGRRSTAFRDLWNFAPKKAPFISAPWQMSFFGAESVLFAISWCASGLSDIHH